MGLSILSLYIKLISSLVFILMLAGPATLISAEKDTSNRELIILNWSEYIDPEIVEKFEKQYKVKVKPIYFESDDYRDNYMLEIDGNGVDLIMINGARIRSYVKQNWISPFTEKEVPNLRYIDKKWLNMFESSAGYVMPYFWGTTGIAYRKDLVEGKVTSWLDLFQPKEAQRGKVAKVGAHRDLIGTALKALGYSMNTSSFKELKEAKELLLKQKPFVKDYDYITLGEESSMAKGDIHMSFGYSGDILGLKEHSKNIEYVVPKEGTNLWVDFWVVAKASKNKAIAYQFLNFLNQPAHAAQLAEWLHYASPNMAAEKLLPKEFLADELIYPSKEILKKSEIYKRLPPRVTRFTNEIFSRVTQE